MQSLRFLLLLLAFCTALTAHSETLMLDLPSDAHGEIELEQGKYLRADIYLDSDDLDIDDLNLSAWKEQFHIEQHQSSRRVQDSRWPNRAAQKQRLRLFPRRTGVLQLAPLALGELRTTARTINVLPAVADTKTMNLQASLSSASVWQREQIRLAVKVEPWQPRLHVTSPQEWKPPGFEAIRLADSHPSSDSIQLNWALYPLTSGALVIEPPAMDIRTGGAASRRFYLPAQEADVQPLPPYIPPTLPVGKLALTSQLQSPLPLRAGELALWELTVSSPTLPAAWLPDPRASLRNISHVRLHPIKRSKENHLNVADRLGDVRYQVPFTPLSTGPLELPRLRLNYFDPQSGTLKAATFPTDTSRSVWVIAAWWLPSAIVIGTLILAWGVFIVGKLVLHRLHATGRKRAILAQAQEASSPCQLIQLSMQLPITAPDQNTQIAATFQQWLEAAKVIQRNDCEGFVKLARQLSESCYGERKAKSSLPFPTAKERWLGYLASLKPSRLSKY